MVLSTVYQTETKKVEHFDLLKQIDYLPATQTPSIHQVLNVNAANFKLKTRFILEHLLFLLLCNDTIFLKKNNVSLIFLLLPILLRKKDIYVKIVDVLIII